MTNSSCVVLCLLMFVGPLMMISCILYEKKQRNQRFPRDYWCYWWECFAVTLITLVLTYVEYRACAFTLISTSLLTSAWMRSPFWGVGFTNLGRYSPSWHEGATGSTGVQKEIDLNSKVQHVFNTYEKTAPVLLFMDQNFQAFTVWPHQGI